MVCKIEEKSLSIFSFDRFKMHRLLFLEQHLKVNMTSTKIKSPAGEVDEGRGVEFVDGPRWVELGTVAGLTVLAVTVTAATAAEGSGCCTGPFCRGKKWGDLCGGYGELGALTGVGGSSPKKKMENEKTVKSIIFINIFLYLLLRTQVKIY